ncbi:asparaginase, partial [Candidatus Gracilibacteria bacterium]|nr:asparaginase [Candidatus Gracilibacteria bacterium]
PLADAAARPAPLVAADLVRGLHWPAAMPRSLVYAEPDGQPLRLDLYQPPVSSAAAPAVIVIHGGSWQSGDSAQLASLNSYLAEHGYVVAAINYRFSPQHVWPAARDDVLAAIAYLKTNAAEFGLDPERLVLLGRSAGGQLALATAYGSADPAIRGVVSFYAPTDLLYGYENPSNPLVIDSRGTLEAYLAGTPASAEAAYMAASAALLVNENTPPTLIFHGDRDELVRVRHAEILSERLSAAGRSHLFVRLPWATHGFDFNFGGPGGQISTYAIEHFFGGGSSVRIQDSGFRSRTAAALNCHVTPSAATLGWKVLYLNRVSALTPTPLCFQSRIGASGSTGTRYLPPARTPPARNPLPGKGMQRKTMQHHVDGSHITDHTSRISGILNPESGILNPESGIPNAPMNILLIHTGGTIGMCRQDDGSYAPAPGYLAALMAAMPELRAAQIPQYTIHEHAPLLDSANMTPSDWNGIAAVIAAHYNDYDGFVVLHGTDTMAYTASALAFMLRNLRKPVLLTGSQIPLCELRSDGRDNLITALIVAARYRLPEVCLLFGDCLLRGCRATKLSATGFDAFESPNFPVLGSFGIHIEIAERLLLPMPAADAPLAVQTIDPELAVGALRLFPGISARLIARVLEPLSGLVLEAYGAGNAPANDGALLDVLAAATARGVVIVVCTQCVRGGVDLSTYATGAALARAGAISGFDMTAEAALAKLRYLFSAGYSSAQARRLMQQDLRGELSGRRQE